MIDYYTDGVFDFIFYHESNANVLVIFVGSL